MDIEKLDPKIKLKDSQTPLVLSMNKKNINTYFESINSILIENNFWHINNRIPFIPVLFFSYIADLYNYYLDR